VLEEAWIECRLPGQTYWVEVPYGFTRNPADALAPVRSLAGRPALAPAMMPMRAGDEILPWDYVEYDLGEIQNQWRAEVHVSNPFDAAAEVILYRHDTAIGKSMYLWDLHTPQTRIEIDDPLTRRLHPGPWKFASMKTDCVEATLSAFIGIREATTVAGDRVLTVEDRSYSFTLPSSLFRYTHGSPDYPKPLIPRSISLKQSSSRSSPSLTMNITIGRRRRSWTIPAAANPPNSLPEYNPPMKTTTLVVLALLLVSISIVTLAQQTPAPAPGPAPAYIQVRAAIPHGTLQSVAYKSKSLGTDRKMMVYTPPGYEQSTGKYPLLYLLHGAGSDETSWATRATGRRHPRQPDDRRQAQAFGWLSCRSASPPQRAPVERAETPQKTKCSAKVS
jgi:hypothetical protein